MKRLSRCFVPHSQSVNNHHWRYRRKSNVLSATVCPRRCVSSAKSLISDSPIPLQIHLNFQRYGGIRSFESVARDERSPFTYTPHREWHHHSFMMDKSTAAKELWLENLIKSNSPIDTQAYLVVLRALVDCNEPDAPFRAEKWIIRMENAVETDMTGSLQLTSECYTCIIRAWGQSKTESATLVIPRAERWFRKHLESKDLNLRPDTESCNAFLNACSRGRAFKRGEDSRRWTVLEHAQKSQAVLEHMIRVSEHEGPHSPMAPNVESFNLTIRAWTRPRKNADILQSTTEIFEMMEKYGKNVNPEVCPNVRTYAMLMDAITVQASMKVQGLGSPDSCEADDNALNGKDEMKMMSTIISLMKKADVLPTTVIFNTLIGGWSKLAPIHPDAPYEGEKVLRFMIRMQDDGKENMAPDHISYLMVMRSWLKSTHPTRTDRVAWWLSKQWKEYDFSGDDRLRPTAGTYNLVMKAFSDTKQPQKAQDLLANMVQMCEKHDARDLAPTSASYSAVVRAWVRIAESGNMGALERAIHWFNYVAKHEQREMDGLVAPIEYYGLILAAARKCAPGSPKVLHSAKSLFQQLKESHHTVDALHYSRLLQVGLLALSRPQHDDARRKFLKEVIDGCIRDGLVSKHFLQALANGPVYVDGWTAEESLVTLKQFVKTWPLPAHWTRNVTQKSGWMPSREDLRRSRLAVSVHGQDPFRTYDSVHTYHGQTTKSTGL